jgi:RND family efflux transporter MFP subunit
MTAETADNIKTPNRLILLVIALVAVILAATVAVRGIAARKTVSHEVAQWTDQQVVPTVQLAALRHGPAFHDLVLPGSVQPYSQTPIYARVPGYLKAWNEDIGAQVRAGQVLATIDTPELDQQLAQARAQLKSAQVSAHLAEVTARRWNSLLASGYVSQQTADQNTAAAAAAQATVESYSANVRQLQAMEAFKTVVAPFDGVVTQRNTDVGALINAGSGSGSALFQLSDMHQVRIHVQVPQALTIGLHPDLPATFDMPQYAGQHFNATLARISHATDPNSHSMLVELHAQNPDSKLFAGAYCQVHFRLPGDPNTVRVPATALLVTPQGTQVALLGRGGKVTLKPVTIAKDYGDSADVTSGVKLSDRVIDNPPTTLQNGDTVQLPSKAR